MRKIEVVPYNSEWPSLFEEEKKALLDLDIPTIRRIHHIGSTAVDDLAAKPIIDILLEVDSLESLDQSQKKIEELGYESMGEFGIEGRRYYRKGKEIRTHHIHAFLASNPHSLRHIAFRDYLSANEKIKKEYASLKLKVASQCENDIDRYCDGKNEFIQTHEKLAIKWKKQTANKAGERISSSSAARNPSL